MSRPNYMKSQMKKPIFVFTLAILSLFLLVIHRHPNIVEEETYTYSQVVYFLMF